MARHGKRQGGLKMMIFTRSGYVNSDCVEKIGTSKKATSGGWETRLYMKGGGEPVIAYGTESRIIDAFCPVVAATPGFNKAIAIKDETGWCAELYPVVAWRIYNDDVEPIAVGLEGNISSPMATVLPDGRVEDAGELHEDVAQWLKMVEEVEKIEAENKLKLQSVNT